MAAPPDLGSPMWLIERELGALRRNVEQELITGLREKLHKMILETFMELNGDTDLVSAAKTGRALRTSATSRDTSDSRVQMPGFPPPVPPSSSVLVTDFEDQVDPWVSEVPIYPSELPNHVADSSPPQQDSPKKSTSFLLVPSESPNSPKDSKGDDSDDEGGLAWGMTLSINSGPDVPRDSHNKSRSRRNSVAVGNIAEAMRTSIMTSVMVQDDEAILQRKGIFWSVDPRTHRLARMVRHDMFDYGMGAVLVINAMFIGLRVDWEASNLGADDLPLYVWTDRIFCLAFLTELGLRFYTFRLAYYITEGWRWAYFDTLVVGFQVLEEVVLIAAGDSTMNLGFLKMLKMGRLMRMVRMIRLLPELKSLVLLIMASMSSFMWTCFLLMLLVYMLAVYMVMMTVDSLEKTMGDTSVARAQMQEYWGSVGSAILSCYWCITGGQDWAVVVGPLVEHTGNQVHNVVFSMFVAFATMVLMNLVTGVFVEGAQRLTKEDRDKELSKMAHKVFRLVDDDCSDEISRIEFNRHLKAGNLNSYLSAVDLDSTAADNLFELLDTDKTDSIDVNEFIEGCLRLRGASRSADVAQLLLETRKAEIKHKEGFATMQSMTRKLHREMKQLRSVVASRKQMHSDSEEC